MKIKDFFNLSRINKLKFINNPNNNNNIRFKQKIFKTNMMIKLEKYKIKIPCKLIKLTKILTKYKLKIKN